MKRKFIHEEAERSLADGLCDHRLTSTYAAPDARRYAALETYVGAGVALEYRLEPTRGERHGAAAPLPPSGTTSGTHSPQIDHLGIILPPRRGAHALTTVDELSRRKELFLIEGAAQYHHNELGDVYDLYNACNGVMSGELLDVSKLDELTPGEREVLDVARLREVWEHTATGCTTCAQIVRTLNLARGRLRGAATRAADQARDKGRKTTDD